MCPRDFQRPITPIHAIEEPPALLQAYFCQKISAYINIHNKFIFCERCFEWSTNSENQPTWLTEKGDWHKIFRHTLAIDGLAIGIHCDRCQIRLTNSEVGHNCPECTNKYFEFQQNPDLPGVSRFDEAIIINVEIQVEEP